MFLIIENILSITISTFLMWVLVRYSLRVFCSPIISKWYANAFVLTVTITGLISGGLTKLNLFMDVHIMFYYISVWLVSLNLVVILLYWLDKKQSFIKRLERIPETVLYGLSFIGGGVGALIGQGIFHHKTEKLGVMPLLALVSNCFVYYYILFVLPN
ncbi:MAG: DUF1294 domain-containing protein [Gammaproteobacteria bacterium]|nr:DUF1294 domain-containing protein [Gammaproteobacteria bacterium]